jgi:methionyl-tRNA formyltransferase
MPAVAVEAQRLGLDCIQTQDINGSAVLERLGELNRPSVVVASFGQILRRPLLESCLCLNVHTSLLPKYRGAAPIERALAAGETSTGVTIMRMVEGLDEGPWALQRSLSLNPYDDAGSVGRALARLGAIGTAQALTALSDGTVRWTEQQGQPSYAHKLLPADCAMDTSLGAKGVHDRVRSLSPSIGAKAASGKVEFKILRTWPYGQGGLERVPVPAESVAAMPGRMVANDNRLFIGCGEGVVEVLLVQPVGGGRMSASAFLRGYKDRLGDRLQAGGGAGGPTS